MTIERFQIRKRDGSANTPQSSLAIISLGSIDILPFSDPLVSNLIRYDCKLLGVDDDLDILEIIFCTQPGEA